MKEQKTAENDRIRQNASRDEKVEDVQQHRRVRVMNLARINDSAARHDKMIVKVTMIDVVTTRGVEATEHAALPQIQRSTAAAATRRSTGHHVRNAIAARNIAVDIAHVLLPKRVGMTTMRMRMATETPSPARDASTGATKTSTGIGHVIRTASETGVTAKTETRTTTMSGKRTGREIKIKNVGAAVSATTRKSASMMMISIAHLDGAAKTVTEMTTAEMTARQRASVQQRTM